MTDPEVTLKLSGAFLLGARVIADQNGKDLSYTEISGLGRGARELADSDTTLEDPTAQAAKDRDIGSLLQRLSQGVRLYKVTASADSVRRDALAGCY